MSWTYSGNPASSQRDELRFTISDTNQAEPIMQDEELDYLITEYGSNRNMLMYQAFTRAATLFARDIKRSLGPQSEDPTERLKFFRDQANYFRSKLSVAGISVPVYNYPKVFHKGMHSNPPWPPGGDVDA